MPDGVASVTLQQQRTPRAFILIKVRHMLIEFNNIQP
jgi:hypothetical protein